MFLFRNYFILLFISFLVIGIPSAYCDINWITGQTIEQKAMPPENITGKVMFGATVAISDNYAIVGAKFDDNKSGSVFIFEKGEEKKWTMRHKFISEKPMKNAYMGVSVAITDEFAFAGEDSFDINEEKDDIGVVYVYYRQPSTGIWVQIQKLLPNPIEGTHRFGKSMSIFEDTLVIGAYGNTDESGKVFVFQRDGNQWIQVQCLEPTEPIIKGRFGNAVNIFSDYIIVGAYIETGYLGAAYIFQKIDGIWQQITKLTSPDEQKYSYFGYSVDINNDFAVVGAYGTKMNEINNTGAAYIFKRTDTGWEFFNKLFEIDLEKHDKFGVCLDLEDDILAVGSTKISSEDSGTVYFYKLNGTEITKIKELRASDPQIDGRFGQNIALNKRHIIIGANLTNDMGVITGAVYFYEPAVRSPYGKDGVVSIDDVIHLFKRLIFK